MEEKYFDECKKKYNGFAENYMEKVEEQRTLICKQIKVKGQKYNVIPYRQERLGNKLNGKIVDEIEMKDGYCVYGFDEEGRIRLIERACTSFKNFYDFECYDYIGDKIYEYLCSLISSVRVGINIFEGDKIKETYTIYEKNRWSYDNYIYDKEFLSRIDVSVLDIYGKIRKWHEKFFYDDKKKVIVIQQEENGHRLNRFCYKKMNYKKMEGILKEQIKESCQMIYQESNSIQIDSIEIAVDSVYEIPMLNIKYMHEKNRQKAEKVSNITENEIVLQKFPLDDFEMEAVINSVLKVIVSLWEENVLYEDVQVKVIKEGVTILENENKLPRWLKNNSQIYFNEGKICYKNLKYEKRVEPKSIREIYKDMKKMLNKRECLEKQIEIFEKINKIPADNYFNGEELFVMNAETILYKERLMFGFSLIRQIPCEDEFVQIGINMVYELNDNNKTVSEMYWSNEIKSDFFSFVKETEIYRLLCKEKVYDVNIFWEET